MSISILESCKKRKRRPKLFGFQTFGDPGSPISPTGPFRENIRIFLQQCAEIEDYRIQEMPIWCTLLVHENRSFVVPLYTIEEEVKLSPKPYCDYCRCSGWSNHFVSKRKYHIIIPLDDRWNKRLDDGSFDLDDQTHLLHGLIHCNGFGHLLCINGIEGGSKFLCGREVMDLWDRICTNLRTRKITVEDLSKKRSMDLRLLHGVAYGHPWFGRWGYRFCRGSFGVKEHHYSRALEILSSLELDKIIHEVDETDRGREMKQIIRHYRNLSETQLITLKDLLKFILTVKYVTTIQKKPIQPIAKSPPPSRQSLQRNKQQSLVKEKQIRYRKFATAISNMDSRWPARRLEYAAEVIVKALEEKKSDKFSHGGNGMTRQDVRDAARLHIGDTGLLDYVLKSLNNVIVGNQIVRRAVNPKTRILEYTIHELRNGAQLTEEQESTQNSEPTLTPGNDIYSDVLCVYRSIFLDYPESDMVELATQGVLDSKHFVKEWPLRDEEDHLLTFIIRLMPRLTFTQSESELKSDFMPSGEVVVLPLHTTIGEVKEAAEKALRDTYYVTEQFEVKEIQNLENSEDREVIFGAAESGAELFVKGMGMDLETPLKYQGGVDTWKVRCECGAGDDDGERMVACDICEIWQHTRCCGIDDADNVPPLFVCAACCDSLGPLRI
ncbi:PHD finger protein MALE MEIOCYTE DEATH 1 [Benincasa hispida]|uniref:PHD finger protein MALE MEIOCYTE DEATH 1 n=1 Tax=Benincasa hispida TaxID=102211 RepID=UPI001900390B|nr:PHD finger protein MALE MEIOCYTE DEATH 1 [Benincasa hispida]